ANTATGWQTLFNNTGDNNTADGAFALFSNTTGHDNTADGFGALSSNTTGHRNVANGEFALYSNTTGAFNTANGVDTLYSNTTGNNNIGLGNSAGGALTTGNYNIDIGNEGVAGESHRIRIGTQGTHKRTFIAGIYGVAAAQGVAVYVNSSGQLGTLTSSARFKQDIQAMDDASDALLSLRPVTFRYKKEIDPEGIPQFGLVAEDVAKVNPDLVARDAQGEVYTVRYEAVNAMLLNEFLKEHRQVQKQQKQIENLTAQLKDQAAQIRKVNDKVEMNKPVPQMVLNNQ
ncbi:MAG TPA: tail fiber domain-containing protein, partial [Chthoniobacterales bacterium]|nr:tail fiber domain-containing protein [Chthoniobacterales bacterium]